MLENGSKRYIQYENTYLKQRRVSFMPLCKIPIIDTFWRKDSEYRQVKKKSLKYSNQFCTLQYNVVLYLNKLSCSICPDIAHKCIVF